MNIEELENKIKAFQNEIVKLQEEIEALKNKKENKRWRAEAGEKYYCIDDCLNISNEYDSGAIDDDERHEYHNYFETEEEAEAVIGNIITHIELMELAEELNTEPIDWNDDDQAKFHLYLSYEGGTVKCDDRYTWKFANTVYSTNANFKDEAIKRIGEERLIKYLKGS